MKRFANISVFSYIVCLFIHNAPMAFATQVMSPFMQTVHELPSDEQVAYRQYLEQFQHAIEVSKAEEWRLALKQYLADSHPLAQKYPKLQTLWLNRAKAALLVFDPSFGTEAALTLKNNPAFNSKDVANFEIWQQLENNGWLDASKIPDLQEKIQLEVNGYKNLTNAEKRLILKTQHSSWQEKNHLGVLYSQGHQVPQDKLKSFYWYTQAAADGGALGLYNVANHYALGLSVPKNIEKAIPLYEQSANLGNTEALQQLGHLYMKGKDVPKDIPKALSYYQQAAEQGNPKAQYYLADMYQRGRYMTKDPKKALEWYQKAAEQGLAEAQVIVGYIYANGKGVVQNDSLAIYWYQKAAEQGNKGAKNNLEYMKNMGRLF